MSKSNQDRPADCRQVTTQAELDAALASGACVHIRGDAEPSVVEWQAANRVEPKIAGEW